MSDEFISFKLLVVSGGAQGPRHQVEEVVDVVDGVEPRAEDLVLEIAVVELVAAAGVPDHVARRDTTGTQPARDAVGAA